MRRFCLWTLALACLFGTGAASADPALIAHYPFDGNVNDASGYGNNGSIIGPLVATTDRNGTPNSAYEFNGTNSYVLIPGSASLDSPTNHITMCAWMYMYGNSHVGSAFGPILMKSIEGGNAFMYRMHAAPNYFGAAYTDWNLTQTTTTASLLNVWVHVATTYDGAKHRFYLNGVQVDSAALSVTMTPDARALTIGADFPGYFEVFWGKLDDVRIYSRTLAPAEIASLYGGTTAVGPQRPAEIPAAARAFPNPARGDCAFALELGEPGTVEVGIRDVAGRLVRALPSATLAAGANTVRWDGRTESGTRAVPGLYFAEFRTARGRAVSRVLMVR